MTHHIVVLDVLPEARVAQLRALLPEGFSIAGGVAPGDEAMKALIAEAEFAISGQVGVSEAVLKAARRLKLLHKWGVGVDNIDVAAARSLGIRIARTTGSNALPVAEFTIGLMLSAMRCSAYGHHHLQNGDWRGPGKTPNETLLLSGKTVAIVGFGAIGSNVAKLLKGFGCEILYVKRNPLPAEEEAALGVRRATLDEALERADVLSLHCPLTDETANMIDMAAMRRMKRRAVLVNVARGGVVVETDLVEALKQRVILAAAMDVFSIEPLPKESPLIGLDNCVITPHLAAVTADTFEPTVRRMFANIAAVAGGDEAPESDRVA
jgi:phosphoglycerate dehydrogenase-like enzyme